MLYDVDKQEIVSEFSFFVRPVVHPRLTPFCIHLTSITQANVDGYVCLAFVLCGAVGGRRHAYA